MGRIVVYNVYIPPENSVDFLLCKTFISLLSDHIKRVRDEGFKIFVCGDFNSYNPAFGKYPQENFSNPRVILENDFVAELNLKGHILDKPSFQRGNRKGYLDRIFYSHNNIIEFCHLGTCLNGIGPRQFPDHRPLHVVLTGKSSRFKRSDIRRYPWNSISDSVWEKIVDELNDDLASRVSWLSSETTTPDELAEYLRVSFCKIRSKYLTPKFVRSNTQPYFDRSLRRLKRKVKQVRQRLSRCRRRRQPNTELIKILDKKLKRLAKSYTELKEKKRDEFCKKLITRAKNSLDIKHVMTSLKRLNGDRYLQIPIIPDETARVPKTKLESLNNLNKGFTSVGKSPRTVEYSDQYRQTRKKSANYLRELFQKKGSSKWLDDESDLGIDIKDVREQIMEP